MKAPSKIVKRCDRCDRQFEIPNIRLSPARDLILEYYPCSHCGYVKLILSPNSLTLGSCVDVNCRLPFALVPHRARGMCNRSYMTLMRRTPRRGQRLG